MTTTDSPPPGVPGSTSPATASDTPSAAHPPDESALERWLWLPVNVLQAAAVAAATAVLVTMAIVARVLGPRVPLQMARWLWGPVILAIGGVRLIVEGRENLRHDRVQIFVCNHESMVDIPVVFKVLPAPLRFILKKELAYVPFLGLFAWATGMVFVDRKRRDKALASLRRVRALGRLGGSIMAFPEGTRSRGQGILPFKRGVFVSAIDAQLPIVPIAIEGAERVLPCSGFRVRPGTVRIKIGAAIETTGLTMADREALVNRTREAVIGLHRQLVAGARSR